MIADEQGCGAHAESVTTNTVVDTLRLPS
jgi:hypothetical protein